MNLIAQLFTAKEVLLDLDVPDKQALFSAVGNLWQEQHGLAATKVVDGLNAREKLGPTGLGQGVAIPHARVEGMSKAVSAVVRTKVGIEFGARDRKLATHIFILLVPTGAIEKHLEILSDLAYLFANAKFREQLDSAQNQDEVHRLFASWPIPAQKKR